MSNHIILLSLTSCLLFSISLGQNEEIRLIKTLMEKYPSDGGRPVQNASEVILVNTKLTLLHIHSLDQTNKIFTTTAWLMQEWTDHMLKWNPSDFENLEYILLDPKHIWRPDIVLFNALEKAELLNPVLAHVKSSGLVTLVEPYKFISSCPDVKPDSMSPACSFKFGSWAYDTSKLEISSRESRVDAAYYQANADYELFGTTVEKHAKEYVCCPGTKYGDVTFTIKMKKRHPEPEVDPNESKASTRTVALTTTIAALTALYVVLTPVL